MISDITAQEVADYWGSWLSFRQTYLRVPGIQAALLLDDQVLFSGACGVAAVGTELTTDHLFRIASHSKTFTATAVLQLVEQERLRLDDAVSVWLPWLTSDVTVRELLAHGSGMTRDGLDGDFWQLRQPFPSAVRLREIALLPGVLSSNERFKYSNIGYSLLGLVIEAVSGQTYASYVSAALLEPLGLRDTGPELDRLRIGDYAAGHSSLAYAPQRVVIEQQDTQAMAAATGFWSKASDVVLWFAAHFDGDERVLSDASKRRMRQRQWDTTPGETDFGYGLGLALTTIGKRTLIGHGGGYPGHITSSVADPVERFAVSVLTNAIDGPAQECAHAAVHLLDLALRSPRPPAASDLSRYCGRFADLWGVLDIAALGGRLWMLSPTQANPAAATVELEVVSDTELRFVGGSGYGSPGELLRYTFGTDGSIESVRMGSGVTRWPLSSYTLSGPVTLAAQSPL